MSDEPTTNSGKLPKSVDERANHLGWGVGFFVAGGLMIAKQLGWINNIELLLPAVILGLGTAHFYKAFCRR